MPMQNILDPLTSGASRLTDAVSYVVPNPVSTSSSCPDAARTRASRNPQSTSEIDSPSTTPQRSCPLWKKRAIFTCRCPFLARSPLRSRADMFYGPQGLEQFWWAWSEATDLYAGVDLAQVPLSVGLAMATWSMGACAVPLPSVRRWVLAIT